MSAVVKDIIFSLGVVKYGVCLSRGCDGHVVVFVGIVRLGAAGDRVWEV